MSCCECVVEPCFSLSAAYPFLTFLLCVSIFPSVAISPQEEFILFGDGDDGTIRVNYLNRSNGPEELEKASLSIKEKYVHVKRKEDSDEKGKRTAKGTALFLKKGHSEEVDVLLISRDEKKLFSASRDYTINIWNVEATKHGNEDPEAWFVARTLVGHKANVATLSESPKGAYLVSGGGWGYKAHTDTKARVWDVRTGVEVRSLPGHKAMITSAAYLNSEDFAVTGDLTEGTEPTQIVTASMDGTVRWWNLSARGRDPSHLKGHEVREYEERKTRGGKASSKHLLF